MRALVAAVAVCGCGDGVDLSGMYRVDAAVQSSPCGADEPERDPPPFLRFTRQQLYDQDYFAYEECADEAGASCSGPGVFGGFPEPVDDGWMAFASFSSGVDGSCLLGITERTALRHGRALVVEEHTYRASGIDLPQAQCTPTEAEARGKDQLPCFAHSRIDATRL
jgi:hypothetical protein